MGIKYAFNGFLFSQRQTGVMRFAKEILLVIDNLSEKGEFQLVIPEYADFVPNLKNIILIKYGKTKGNLWEQVDFYKYLKMNKLESVNFNNTIPLLRPGIVVIHDIAYKIHPEFANSFHGKISNIYHRMIFARAAKSNKIIVTVSHFSKIQLIENYSIDPSRVVVIGNAWQHFNNIGIDDSIININKLETGNYFFSLGSLSKMKNTKWIIEVAKENPECKFVLAGAKPKNESESLEQLPNVLMVGFVSDEQVKSLILNCKAFIYPSIYDGFGIPPLEALSQGAKVVCSCAACLPEVYRNTVHYIDPYETNIDIDKLLEEPVDQAEEVLKRYSWENSGKEFLKILKRES